MQNDERDARDLRQPGDTAGSGDVPEVREMTPPPADTPRDEEWPPDQSGAYQPADQPAAQPADEPSPAPEPAPAEEEAQATWPSTDDSYAEPAPPPADAESWEARPDETQTMPRLDEEAAPPPSEVEAFGEPPPAATDAAAASAAAASAHSVPATEVGESTKCPRCGTENRPGLAFCRSCGQRLVAAGVAPTVERPGTPEGTQACPRCGTHNRAGVAFCQNCGANLRQAAAGYVPPAVAPREREAVAAQERGRAILGPIVLLIGAIGLATGWLLPFAYGTGSLFDRSFGSGGWGIQFWNGYGEVPQTLADQAYFGFAAPSPVLTGLLTLLAIGGFVRANPGLLQRIGLLIALLWAVGLAVLFGVVEVAGNWGGELIAMLRDLSPGGIILFLASLIVVIGTLTRFGRG